MKFVLFFVHQSVPALRPLEACRGWREPDRLRGQPDPRIFDFPSLEVPRPALGVLIMIKEYRGQQVPGVTRLHTIARPPVARAYRAVSGPGGLDIDVGICQFEAAQGPAVPPDVLRRGPPWVSNPVARDGRRLEKCRSILAPLIPQVHGRARGGRLPRGYFHLGLGCLGFVERRPRRPGRSTRSPSRSSEGHALAGIGIIAGLPRV